MSTPRATINTSQVVDRGIDIHLAAVPHGTTVAEQDVMSAFEAHLDPLDRNPHGITPNDLDVYTKAQVDALIGPVQIFNCGGFV